LLTDLASLEEAGYIKLKKILNKNGEVSLVLVWPVEEV